MLFYYLKIRKNKFTYWKLIINLIPNHDPLVHLLLCFINVKKFLIGSVLHFILILVLFIFYVKLKKKWKINKVKFKKKNKTSASGMYFKI